MSLRLEHVTYTYSPGSVYETHALKDVSLEIPAGQFLGVIGHTGSGKSTLIQHFNGLMRPTAGTVYYKDEDIWQEGYSLKRLRSQVSWCFSIRSISFLKQMYSPMCALAQKSGLLKRRGRGQGSAGASSDRIKGKVL